MKISNLFILPVILFILTSCSETKDDKPGTNNQAGSVSKEVPAKKKAETRTGTQAQTPEKEEPLLQKTPEKPEPQINKAQVNVPPQVNKPAANSGRVFHFVCGNGCEGGANSAGNCPECGKTLVHNQAFHNQQNNQAPQLNQQRNAQPAQNPAGEWHYVCARGCEGGAGTPAACTSCGQKLVHNQNFHN